MCVCVCVCVCVCACACACASVTMCVCVHMHACVHSHAAKQAYVFLTHYSEGHNRAPPSTPGTKVPRLRSPTGIPARGGRRQRDGGASPGWVGGPGWRWPRS